MSKDFDLIGGLLMIGVIAGAIVTVALVLARREAVAASHTAKAWPVGDARKVAGSALLVLLGLMVLAQGAVAQTPANSADHADHHPQDATSSKPAAKPDMMANCQAMMAERQQAAQRMDARDKKLDSLVAEMNQVKGDRKVDAMAKVVAEMASQRKEMSRESAQAEEKMMAHMMEMMHGGSDSSAMCPMMKDMQEKMKDMKGNMKGMGGATPK